VDLLVRIECVKGNVTTAVRKVLTKSIRVQKKSVAKEVSALPTGHHC
jgi:hypothetical protein